MAFSRMSVAQSGPMTLPRRNYFGSSLIFDLTCQPRGTMQAATIRLRHRKTKGSGTRRASLAMMFKLAQSAQRRWRRLNGHQQIIP